MKQIFLTIFFSLSLMSTQTTFAKDYKVEVLVFKNLIESRASENHHYQAPKNVKSKKSTWRIQASMLLDEAKILQESSEYQLLHHFAWGQQALPSSEAAIYNVIETDVTGWVKVYAKTLLFANLDLDLDGYRMSENRRLKLDEKHYFDHPKFGILMQVSRLLPAPE